MCQVSVVVRQEPHEECADTVFVCRLGREGPQRRIFSFLVFPNEKSFLGVAIMNIFSLSTSMPNSFVRDIFKVDEDIVLKYTSMVIELISSQQAQLPVIA